MAVAQGTRTLRPGDTVSASGIYRVIHLQHRVPHDVLAIHGEELPPCRTCAGEVRFALVQPLSTVTDDWDLAGVTERLLNDLPSVTAPKRRAA